MLAWPAITADDKEESENSAEPLTEIDMALPNLKPLSYQARCRDEMILLLRGKMIIALEGFLIAAKHFSNPMLFSDGEEYNTILLSFSMNTKLKMFSEGLLEDVFIVKRTTASLGSICQKFQLLSLLQLASITDRHDACVASSIEVPPKHAVFLEHDTQCLFNSPWFVDES